MTEYTNHRLQDILNRMKKAHDERRGIRLTIEDLDSMYVSIFGDIWSEQDPRK